MVCPILEMEDQQNAKRTEADLTLDKIHIVDTTLNMLSIVKKYGNNLKDPGLKNELTNVLEKHQKASASEKLTRANDRIYKNSALDWSAKEYSRDMLRHLNEQNATGNFQGILGATTEFIQKQFKSYTIALSLGRFINESAQAGVVTLSNKISQIAHSPFRKEKFAEMLGIAPEKLPKAGSIIDNSFTQREFGVSESPYGKKEFEMKGTFLETLDRPAKLLRELSGKFLDKSVGKIEQIFYETEFNRFMGDYVNKHGKENVEFLWKENISGSNKILKQKLIGQWRRESRTSTKEAFFSYVTNPLIINKLETFVPFTNFMYSGIKLMNRFPKTLMFGATLLNNAQYAWGTDVWYVDDEGSKIDAGQSLRFPILAAFGLDQVAINTNRMLQVTPGSLGVKPLSVYNWLTGREDPRFKKFYKSGSFADFADLGLSMVSPPIQKIVNALVNWDKNKDLTGSNQNSLADLTESIMYLTTGVVIKDKTTSAAWGYYINKDYDALLNMQPNQLQRFLSQDSMKKKGITAQTIKALKKAKELGILNFSDDPYEKAVVTLSGLPLHESLVSEKESDTDGMIVRHLVETALGKKLIDKDYETNFETTLSRWKELYKSKEFEDFGKAMPGLAKAITHFVEHEDYYAERADAYKLRSSKDDSEQMEGELKLLALNYRFEGDNNMTLKEKMNAMKYGKLNSPLFYGKSNDGIPAHSVVMTDDYMASLEYKGVQTANYMEKANGVAALIKFRSLFWQMAYTANSSSDRNKYIDLAKKMYKLSLDAEHELKVSGTPEYQLFLLSPESDKINELKQKDDTYARNTNWSSSFSSNRNKAISSTKNKIFDQQKALITKLNSMNLKESDFMKGVMNTNADHRSNQLTKMMREIQGQELIEEKGYLQTLFNK